MLYDMENQGTYFDIEMYKTENMFSERRRRVEYARERESDLAKKKTHVLIDEKLCNDFESTSARIYAYIAACVLTLAHKRKFDKDLLNIKCILTTMVPE